MRNHQAISGALISTYGLKFNEFWLSCTDFQDFQASLQVQVWSRDGPNYDSSMMLDEEFTKYFKISVVYSKDLKK